MLQLVVEVVPIMLAVPVDQVLVAMAADSTQLD
jgi:hypothetical protein